MKEIEKSGLIWITGFSASGDEDPVVIRICAQKI
jgi:hypothetical protein